jgi:hypothetical protein
MPRTAAPFFVLVFVALFLGSAGVLSAGDLINLSTRGFVGKGDDVLIGGIIVKGSAPKRVILRAIGASINVNGTALPGTLQDPILDLFDSKGTMLQTNDDWRYGPELDIEASKLAPTDDYESAIIAVFNPGNYTTIIHGYAHSTGTALVEAYDLDPAGNSLAEISTRGTVQSGDNILIAGFVVANSATNVLIRAIGPELTQFRVPNPLQDPTLELRDASGALLEANDDWKTDNRQAISDTGAAPTDDRESAIVRNLAPGNYTALVRGKNGTSGIALVEVYRLP